jgi:hypothetical protein
MDDERLDVSYFHSSPVTSHYVPFIPLCWTVL